MHDLWHVLLLGTILFGAAGAAIVLLAPLLFEDRSIALERARPVVLGILLAGGFLLALEWLVLHGRFL